ncbi:MAG TPA: hypothetical protein DIT65_01900 [Cryomorphaceae bacterium]|nr:hypothetical protein [Cryomorphaceae bacterium]|tara:strand:+ start:7711 stop:8280 length:570 start_codon:yes stop_codon:yes gene_type:complete
MDVKWLFIVFLSVLGAFRALKPGLFAKWIRLQWEELADTRGRYSTSILSLLLPAAVFFVIGEALELGLLWWKAPAAITILLLSRWVFSVLLSLLFSSKNALQNGTNLFGGIQLSYFYSLICFLILSNLIINKQWSDAGIYLLGIGHTIGLLWFAIKSPVLQNIGSGGARFYAMSYLCTLELVLIFSFVN